MHDAAESLTFNKESQFQGPLMFTSLGLTFNKQSRLWTQKSFVRLMLILEGNKKTEGHPGSLAFNDFL